MRSATLLLATALAACGQSGDLYLPPPPAPAAPAGTAPAEPAPAEPAHDKKKD